MNDKLNEAVGGCLASFAMIPVVLALDVILYFFAAFVIVKIWAWFVLPFLAVTPLPITAAIGICLVFSILKIGEDKEKMKQSIVENGQFIGILIHVGEKFIDIFVILSLAWLISWFIPAASETSNRIYLFLPDQQEITQCESIESIENSKNIGK